jgi:hypothetical protein
VGSDMSDAQSFEAFHQRPDAEGGIK